MEDVEQNTVDKWTVPVVITYLMPFTVVTSPGCPEDATWKLSVEELNGAAFDQIRLQRISTGIDVGLPAPFCMYVSFDGALVLPALAGFQTAEPAMEKFNEIMGCLLLGGLVFDMVRAKDIALGVVHSTGYYTETRPAEGLGGRMRFALHQRDSSSSDRMPIFSPKRLAASDLVGAYRRGQAVHSRVPQLSLTLVQSACAHARSGGHADALAAAWICCEQLLDVLWTDKVIGLAKAKGLDSAPLSSDKFTSMHRIEVLLLLGVLPKQLHGRLATARVARNRLAHGGVVPTRHQCRDALLAIGEMLTIASCLPVDGYQQFGEVVGGPIATGPRRRPLSNDDMWRELVLVPGDKGWAGGPAPNGFEVAGFGPTVVIGRKE